MGVVKNLQPIILTPLNRVKHPKGDILHGIKDSDHGYVGFGEAYFTTVISGEIKGWKRHNIMTMNLIAPIGMVRFWVHDSVQRKTMIHDLGDLNYCRLTVPPGYWVAFQGLDKNTNLILNVSNCKHDPIEAINAPLTDYPLESQ